MTERGHRVYVLTADEPVPKTDVFIAFHQDGSNSSAAHGASVGYQTSLSRAYATTWKALYQAAGWPGGFRPDNYTPGLRGYYGFRKAQSRVEVIFEHGFATNHSDANWMWDNIERTAIVHADTLDGYFSGGTPPPEVPPDMATQLDRIEAHLQGRNPGDGTDAHRKFVHEQHRHTRNDIAKEGEAIRVGVVAALGITTDKIIGRIDELDAKIEALAAGGGDGSDGVPVNVTPADVAAIAEQVGDELAERMRT